MRRILAIIAALGLTLALAGPALAATTSSSTAATATVDATISMSGVPASYDFGHGVPGTDLTGPTFTITTTSSETTFQVTAATTNFTKGGDSIPASALRWNVGGSQFQATGAGVPVVIGSTATLGVSMTLTLPAVRPAGVYTATVTFTASN